MLSFYFYIIKHLEFSFQNNAVKEYIKQSLESENYEDHFQ